MKIPCTGERREGVSQARETCKVCMMSQSKISGWGQLLRKGQCGCSERKNNEKFGKGRRVVGLPRLGWGMWFVTYVTREVTHALPSGDVPGHPKCRAQEQEQVHTVPSGQRPASPKPVTAGRRAGVCWRHSGQQLLTTPEAGGRGEGRAKDTLQFPAETAEWYSRMAGETWGRTSFGGEEKNQMLFRYADFKRPVQFPRRDVR